MLLDKNAESRLVRAAQEAAVTKPVIGGQGPDATRQEKLNNEIGLDPKVVQAKEDLTAGKINVDQFNKIAGTNR